MTTATEARQTLIERWVYLYALGVLVNNLVVTRKGDLDLFPGWPEGVDVDEIDIGGAAALGDELWPTEADYDGDESQVASARMDSILAALFAKLATEEGRDFCARSAARFANIAAQSLATAGS